MPWKVSHFMNERMAFLTRLLKGERMTDLCEEFGISRKTGYKFRDRYQLLGSAALEDQSRAPKRVARKTSDAVAQMLVATRRAHSTWGGRKIKAMLELGDTSLRLPSASTIALVLRQHGLVQKRRLRHRPLGHHGQLTTPDGANDVWAADYKGQFRLGNGAYCYPLTATDLYSRFILAVEALDATDEEQARCVFESVFRTYGLPRVLRTDNGTPFASQGLAGLTKLSAWWLRLGIRHQRTEPAHPEQNGSHERMHRTLKAETTRPARDTSVQQQERFDDFRDQFNKERPHEAIDMKRPADLYQVSERVLPDPLPDLKYPLHDDVLSVTGSGHVRLPRGRVTFLSHALAGQLVGLREHVDGTWLVTFCTLDLGTYDPRVGSFNPIVPVIPAGTP
jgi:transposase InsO family protein